MLSAEGVLPAVNFGSRIHGPNSHSLANSFKAAFGQSVAEICSRTRPRGAPGVTGGRSGPPVASIVMGPETVDSAVGDLSAGESTPSPVAPGDNLFQLFTTTSKLQTLDAVAVPNLSETTG